VSEAVCEPAGVTRTMALFENVTPTTCVIKPGFHK
jgi:hypothetical protein